MKISVLSILLCLSIFSYGQKSNIVVFTENGEEFTLFVNGSQINEEPATNVKAKGISSEYVQIKVSFEIPGAPDVTSNTPIMEAGQEITYVVKKNNKGRYVVRFMSSSYITETEDSTEKVAIVTTPPERPHQSTPPQQSTPSTYTETTTTSQQPKTQNGFGISISAGGETISMNMSMDDEEQTTSTITTTSSRTYSSSSNTNSNPNQSNVTARVENNQILLSDGRALTMRKEAYQQSFTSAIEMKEPVGAKVLIRYNDMDLFNSDVPFLYADRNSSRSGSYFTVSVLEPSGKQWSVKLQLKNASKLVIESAASSGFVTVTPTTTPAQPEVVVVETGCQNPMGQQSFFRAVESIDSKVFREEKLTVLKQVIKTNCVSVNQVTELMELFEFEEDKLKVAKLCYPKTVDKGNYYQVNDSFVYSDSVSELEDFLNKQ